MADAKTQALQTVKGFMPNMPKGTTVLTVGVVLIIAIIFLVGVGFVTFLIVRKRKFNKKIVIWEKIDGQFKPTGKDRAMEIKWSTAGDTIFYLMNRKIYKPRPTIQTGPNTFWYFIREDGEWINFGPGDFDEDSRKLHARFLDKEMRYARTQIQKGLRERYEKPNFWTKYGTVIMSVTFIVLIGMMTWLLFDKWVKLASETTHAIEVGGQVMEQAKNVLAALGHVCQGGSGYTPGG